MMNLRQSVCPPAAGTHRAPFCRGEKRECDGKYLGMGSQSANFPRKAEQNHCSLPAGAYTLTHECTPQSEPAPVNLLAVKTPVFKHPGLFGNCYSHS